MALFRFAVSGQFLDLLTPTKGISDGINANSMIFDFRSPEWEGTKKWAHFYNPDYKDGTPVVAELIDDGISYDRGLDFPPGIWEIYVHGDRMSGDEVVNRYITETQTIQIVEAGTGGDPIFPIDDSMAEQILAKANAAYNARITTGSAVVVSGPAEDDPYVEVVISGEDGYKNMGFVFHNINAVGIQSVVFTDSGENKGRITITLTNGVAYTFDGLKDAFDFLDSLTEDAEAFAAGTRGGVEVPSSDPAYHNNSKYYKEISDENASDAEAYATGKRGGADVPSTDPAYHNNGKYYNDNSSIASASATENALKSEGYAVGKQDGSDVPSGSPYYQNNAKYYSDQADASSQSAGTDALISEGYAVGKQNGSDVQSGSPYYHNNAKYYSDTLFSTFGYIYFYIDENGDLRMMETGYSTVDFYLEDGDLYLEVTE